MGLITYNGVLLRKGDLLASSTDCCCGGCCCIYGAKDPTKTTKADCEAANGTWYPNQPCASVTCPGPCACLRCCECADGTLPVIGGSVRAGIGMPWGDWDGTKYNSISAVIVSGKCCCCDWIAELAGLLQPAILNPNSEAQWAAFEGVFGAVPGRYTYNGETFDPGWSAVVSCSAWYAYRGVVDPCANYPVGACSHTWCAPAESCNFICPRRSEGGFKSLSECNPLP